MEHEASERLCQMNADGEQHARLLNMLCGVEVRRGAGGAQ